jgi:hypothetical protein
MGTPPKRGIDYEWIFLSAGRSRAFTLLAIDLNKGVDREERVTDMAKGIKYFII